MTENHAGGVAEKFSSFQNTLRQRYGDYVFDAWMADLALQNLTEDAATLATPSGVKADRLNQQYKPGILQALREEVRPVTRVDIVAMAGLSDNAARAEAKVRGPSSRRTPRRGAGAFTDFGKAPISITPNATVPGAAAGGAATSSSAAWGAHDNASPLDPRCTFESFAVDASNDLAFAAARRVFLNGTEPDIVYIYGPSGCGKTHLLHSIAEEWRRSWPDGIASYFTYSNMRDGCSWAATSSGLKALHDAWRAHDLILIDDLHLLIGSTRTQEEILNLANTYPSAGGRLVIAGELAPMRLAEAGLNQRLADRLAGGLAAPIERGGETLRLEVIKKRRDRTDMECLVSDEACAFIARHFPQSMRAAIGALKQIVLVYGSSGLTVGVEEARRALKTHLLDATRRVTLDDLLDAVAEEFELKPDDLTGRAQPQRIVRARHAFVMIGRDSLKESFPKLARALRRDHTTAMNSYEKAYIHYERLEAYREHIARIEAALNLPPPDRSGGPQKLR